MGALVLVLVPNSSEPSKGELRSRASKEIKQFARRDPRSLLPQWRRDPTPRLEGILIGDGATGLQPGQRPLDDIPIEPARR